ncbi:SRPBCC family protein [Chelativorans sp. AA-79]|uniref:SRPBCC family protein n=1 Tax=Chelativorans sp. AA-79 TaxID=3028735 RepID=UPI0023F703E1|nr:SRPBCC family protein [Chelativorans sp. AA-79]WEX09446.1 SRPBCC family protein [Chelativorans sp. AA-79]
MNTQDFTATGEVIAPGTVRIERLLPGPVERLWEYLTNSEKRRLWLAAGGIELFPGGKVELLFRHRELSHEPTPDRYKHFETSPAMFGEVIECDSPRLITYSWPGDSGKSEVTFELFPEGPNVRLVLTHRRLEGTEMMISVASGWEAHLGILEDRLAGGEPRGFWSTHAGLEKQYAGKFAAQG